MEKCRGEIEHTNLQLRKRLNQFKRVLIASVYVWKSSTDETREQTWPKQIQAIRDSNVETDAQLHMAAIVGLLKRLNEEDRKIEPLLKKAWDNFSSFA
jgi:hypothetical protein